MSYGNICLHCWKPIDRNALVCPSCGKPARPLAATPGAEEQQGARTGPDAPGMHSPNARWLQASAMSEVIAPPNAGSSAAKEIPEARQSDSRQPSLVTLATVFTTTLVLVLAVLFLRENVLSSNASSDAPGTPSQTSHVANATADTRAGTAAAGLAAVDATALPDNASPNGGGTHDTGDLSCAGMKDYESEIQDWWDGFESEALAAMGGRSLDEDHMPTSEELGKVGEIARDYAYRLDDITVPESAKGFHSELRRYFLLISDVLIAMREGGFFAGLAYSEQLDAQEARLDELAAAIEEACDVAIHDHDGDDKLEKGWGQPTPTPTLAPTSTPEPTPTPLNDNGGTRTNPIPFGESAALGNGWRLSVEAVDFNATDVILAESSFNEPPPPDHRYVLVTVRATYEGPEESASVLGDVRLKAVGASALAYSTSDADCGAVPNDASSAPEVFAGGTVTVNYCWSVPAQDVESLVIFADPSFSDGQRVFFALRP